MAGRRRPRGATLKDPYEAAVDRVEVTGQQGQEHSEEEPDPGPDFSASFRRQKWAIVAIGALILVAGLVQSGGTTKRPKLAPDCANSRLVLSATSVKQGGLVRWTATGAAEGTVVLAIDVAQFTRATDGTLRRDPLAGKSPDSTQTASQELQLVGCSGTGLFGAVVPAGQHTVSLFRVSAGGAEPVASARLRVTASR